MANGHGGKRPNAGRKRKALADKLLDGNPGHEPIKKLKPLEANSNIEGCDMPPVSEYLQKMTKNTVENLAPKIFEETWLWLRERNCDSYVKKELIEQYALYIARWIQCEEGINTYGLLAKHATTNMPIASPYVQMGLNFIKQANSLWGQIFQIVKENNSEPVGKNPNDDIMERLLSGAGKRQ